MGIVYNNSIVTDGLVLCLDAANPRSYPQTGSTWYDISGNNFHANLFNSPTFTGKSFAFDGTNQYGQIDSNIRNVIEASSQFTLITLSNIKFIEHVDNLVGWGNANTSNGYARTFGQYAYFSTLNTSYSNNGPGLGNMTTINLLDKWLLLVSRYDNLEYYSDVYGSVTNSSYRDQNGTIWTWKEIPTSYEVTIAKTSYFSRYMQVDISAILMYNRFISNSEIFQNFNTMRGRFNI